jgi:hypothetical protein
MPFRFDPKYYNAETAKELQGALAALQQQVAPSPSKKINLLDPKQGGQIVAASNDTWRRATDGKAEPFDLRVGEEAVYAFKAGQAATFDTFSVLIPKADVVNVQEIELLVGDESPTGRFRTIGIFKPQNIKVMGNDGYQEFTFPAVTSKYVKVKGTAGYLGQIMRLYEFRLLGHLE